MPARTLGRDGPSVSRLCLGAMMFGDRTHEGEAREMVAAFAEAGGSFIDTADSYAGGESERIVGRAIASERGRWTLATKLGNPVAGHPGSGGLSAAWVREGLQASLGRLGVETVDLLYLHVEDEATPLEETIGALGEALEAGRIRAWGFSNVRAWKIAEMIRLCDRLGVARPLAAQPYYHALYRLAETDYLPACRHFGIGVVPYSPLARGVLTGKYASGTPEGSRAARGDTRILETEMRPELLEAARAFSAHAGATGRRPADLALRWVLENQAVASVLIGPRTMAQLQGYLDALACSFGPQDEEAVDAIAPPGTAIGLYTDPRYPIRGRFASSEGLAP